MSTNTKTYSYRMDATEHDKASSILSKLGMDNTTAIRIFFKMVEENNGLPFEVKLRDPEITPEIAKDIEASEKDLANGNYKSYDNVDDAIKDLNS